MIVFSLASGNDLFCAHRYGIFINDILQTSSRNDIYALANNQYFAETLPILCGVSTRTVEAIHLLQVGTD